MRYRLRELCRLYLPWLFACLCVFACPPREHSSSLSLSLSLYYYSISLSRCIVLSLFWLSVSFYRYFVAHKPLQFTETRLDGFAYEERGLINRFWATRSFRIHANPSRYHLLVSLSLSSVWFRFQSWIRVDRSRLVCQKDVVPCIIHRRQPPPTTTTTPIHTTDRTPLTRYSFFFLIMHPNIRQSIYPREEWNK